MSTRIVCISDTHGGHFRVDIPNGDILIHAGDVSLNGTAQQIQCFLDWFSMLPHKHKVFIAGNHDWLAERNNELFRSMIPENVIYLEDSGCEIEGLKFWGSPASPTFYDWAFNYDRGREISKVWSLIPDDVDVLITHGPPEGILDHVRGRRVGCADLEQRIRQLRNLKLHVFGHIHEGHGEVDCNGVTYINASVLDEMYRVMYDPIVIEL